MIRLKHEIKKFYYTLIIIAPRGQKMVEQRRIASCVAGSYRFQRHIYKKYGQQQLEKYARETGNVLDRSLYSTSQWTDGNIVGHLPTESIRGLFPIFYVPDCITIFSLSWCFSLTLFFNCPGCFFAFTCLLLNISSALARFHVR